MIKRILDPFEWLYVAIAIATFEHTTWTSAFMFEGPLAEGASSFESAMWYFRGGLIAIAIDVGMLLTSRFLASTRSKWPVLILSISFGIAAIASFYMQIGYILYHTPTYELSEGVDATWAALLEPLMKARVLLLPLFLPLLATVYTLARIVMKRDHEEMPPRVVPMPRIIEREEGESGVPLLASGDPDVDSGLVDLEGLRFFDEEEGRWRGPYKSRRSMAVAMKSLHTRRMKEIVRQDEEIEL